MHDELLRLTLGLAFTFTLIGMASTLASGALPPTYLKTSIVNGCQYCTHAHTARCALTASSGRLGTRGRLWGTVFLGV